MKKIIFLISLGVLGFITFLLINNQDYSEEATEGLADISFLKDNNTTDTETGNLYETDDFSFKYGERLDMSRVPDSGGEIIAVENNDLGFQIFILPFNESGPITVERILKDLPNMKINHPTTTTLGGIPSIKFFGYIAGLGDTFETWVIYKNQLYQIMTSQSQEKLLLEVLDTWKWK